MCILLVEDDVVLVQCLVFLLEQVGYVVVVVVDGCEVEEIGQIEDLQVVIVDFGLFGLDGLSVIECWCSNGCSFLVLVLIVCGCWYDKLVGFDVGVDDYLIKFFQVDELVLWLCVLICCSYGYVSLCLYCGLLQLDVNVGCFELDGQVLFFSLQEFCLFSYFIYYSGQVIGCDWLGEQVFDGGYDLDFNVLDVLFGCVCCKFGIDLIQIVCGQGWWLVVL